MTTSTKGTRINFGTPLQLLGLALLLVTVFAVGRGCQSRGWSRFTGEPLQLELPDDFEQPISFSTGREGEKDLFYKNADGQFKVKTYTDSGMFEAEIHFVEEE